MKLRFILIASVGCLMAGVFAVGHNASSAQALATQVLSLDTVGQPTASAQATLASYVHRHMGASTSIFLATSYQRASVSATSTGGTSGQVYHDAQAACVSKTTAVNQAACVQSYVAAHSTQGASVIQPVKVDKATYTVTYSSPLWTPDLAGLLLALAVVGLAVGIVICGLRISRHFGYTNK